MFSFQPVTIQSALPIYQLFSPTNQSTDGWVVGADNAAFRGEFYTITFLKRYRLIN